MSITPVREVPKVMLKPRITMVRGEWRVIPLAAGMKRVTEACTFVTERNRRLTALKNLDRMLEAIDANS